MTDSHTRSAPGAGDGRSGPAAGRRDSIATAELPKIPPETVAEWQRVIDLVARLAQVPASLVMRTDFSKHTVFVASRTEGNPYRVGTAHELDESKYCHGVVDNDEELVVEDASRDSHWSGKEGLNNGMGFYIGYPLKWPEGEPFGTICVLDRKRNEHALLFREGLRAFGGVIESNLRSLVEIARRKRLESERHEYLERLEDRVAERTRELEEANTALRVLLSTAENTKREHNAQILRQIRTLVIPHLEKLARFVEPNGREAEYLSLVESNLSSLTTSLSSRMASEFEALTSTEAEVAQLIMRGKTTKEIAEILTRSVSTIDFHRNNIRGKLGLRRCQNLRAYLRSIN